MSDVSIGDDNDDTIIDLQSIVERYKECNKSKSSENKAAEWAEVIELSDDNSETGPPPTKKTCELEPGKSDAKDSKLDEVDKLLQELSTKYNIDINTDYKVHDVENGQLTPCSNIYNQQPPSSSNTLKSSKPRIECISSDESSTDSNDCMNNLLIIPPFQTFKNKGDNKFSYSEDIELDEEYTTNNKKTKAQSSEMKKMEKRLLQEEKQKERQRKREEAQRSKELKKAIQMSNKNIKPEEAVKFITAIIDNGIMNNDFANDVITSLETLGCKSKIVSQIVPNSVTWVKTVQSHLLNEDGKLTLCSNLEETDQILVLMKQEEFLGLVHSNALSTHIHEIQSMCGDKRISLGIYRMEGYFKKKQKKDRQQVSRKDVEFALTELQLFCNCCYRFLETEEDVGGMVAQFTKSIAQVPYKMEKQEKYMQAERYMSGDNKDCVRVDKDGNGLQRLWQQQLTSFPLTRIETAEAIMSQYPTLNSLMEAYDYCKSETEKEQLLRDIPIRRAAGPITNQRKIGPELSRKIGIFYNSADGGTVL